MSGSPGDRRTLGRAAALILGAGIVALLVGNGPALWERIAYREPTRKLGIELREKRWGWLPGPGLRIAEQPCPSCQGGDHHYCARRTGSIRIVADAPAATTRAATTMVSMLGAIRYTISSEGGGPARSTVEMSAFSIDGVTITPATFRCPCCPAE